MKPFAPIAKSPSESAPLCGPAIVEWYKKESPTLEDLLYYLAYERDESDRLRTLLAAADRQGGAA